MECSKIHEMIPFYSDSSLNPGEEALVRDHLIHCAECRREYEEIRAVTGFIRKSFNDNPVETMPGYLGMVRNKIHAEKHRKHIFYRTVSVAAVLFLVVTSVMYSYLNFHPSVPVNTFAEAGKNVSEGADHVLKPADNLTLFGLSGDAGSGSDMTDEEIVNALISNTMVDMSSHEMMNLIDDEDLTLVLVSY